MRVFSTSSLLLISPSELRNGNGETDDLWDFGTIRHGARTIGRSSIKLSGLPLAREKDDLPHNRDSDGSDESTQLRRGHASSTSPSMSAKSDLPSTPSDRESIRLGIESASSPSKTRFERDTLKTASVRNVPDNRGQPIATDYAIPQRSHRSGQTELLDEEYGNNYTYSTKTGAMRQKMAEMHIEEDDFNDTDTTMLDSVILPAIASVSTCHSPSSISNTMIAISTSFFPRS